MLLLLTVVVHVGELPLISPLAVQDVTLSSIEEGKEAPKLFCSHLGKYKMIFPVEGTLLAIVKEAVKVEYWPTINDETVKVPAEEDKVFGVYYIDTDEDAVTSIATLVDLKVYTAISVTNFAELGLIILFIYKTF